MGILKEAKIVGLAMIGSGGSFIKALGYALCRADATNALVIKDAFPVYWSKYLALGKRSMNTQST